MVLTKPPPKTTSTLCKYGRGRHFHPERLCVFGHQQDGRTILRNPLIPGTKIVSSRFRSRQTPPPRPASAPRCQWAKEIGLDPPFAQRVDFERLWREAELPFKLCIGSPMDVPNLDTVFEAASSQRTVVYRSRSISTIRI